MDLLPEAEIEQLMKTLPDWALAGDAIQRTYNFTDFVAAIAFINKVAAEAERVQHHPDILIRYNKVTLTLSTHDAGGLTEKDFNLAATADRFLDTRRRAPAS